MAACREDRWGTWHLYESNSGTLQWLSTVYVGGCYADASQTALQASVWTRVAVEWADVSSRQSSKPG